METMRAILMYMAVTAMLFKFAVGTDHTVGAPSGSWDLTTDLNTWATSQNFSVGDNLIFQYTPLHTVLQVSKADYDACVADTPIQSFVGGTTTILLSTAVKMYFICGTGGHCGQGMKVEIDIVAATTTPPPSPPSTTPSPPTTTPSPPSPVEPPPSIPFPSPLPPSTPSPASSPKTSATSPSPGPTMIPTESSSDIFPPVALPPPDTQNNGHLQVKPAMWLGFGIITLLAL